MKYSMALFLSAVTSAASESPIPFFGKAKKLTKDIKADSALGKKLISKARRLDEDEEADYSWVTDYSLKFQGCFHVSQWNDEADDEEDVRIMTKRLVRFRLCPTDYCSYEVAGGCSSGYGDYIIDMNTFVDAYIEQKQQAEEQACENVRENCNCDDDNRRGRRLDEDACEYQCYVDAGLENCYEDEDEEEKMDPYEYMECAQFDVPEDEDNGRRRLDEEEEIEYFIGPFCANQGGDIYLGMFTDDTCSTFADSQGGGYTYSSFVGSKLPYSSTSLVGSECVSCLQEEEDNGRRLDENEPEVTEACMQMYEAAGKCESGLSSVVTYPNENACTFMEGIKIIRKNGTVNTEAPAASKTASAFIGVFAVSFCLLGAYVYYLKTKLDKAKINLADS